MSAKTTKVVGSRPSRQSLERAAGTPEPADPGAFYRVEPGETHPEFFPDSLPGQAKAIARAEWLSVAHSVQRVLITRDVPRLALPACRDKVIRRCRGGASLWAASGGQPDRGEPAGEAAVVLDLRGM
jgi:hypothetical protein